MYRTYLIKDENGDFYCYLMSSRTPGGKGEIVMTDKLDDRSFMKMHDFPSIVDARETAYMLANSKWLKNKGKVFEVVEAIVSDTWTEEICESWWRTILGIPNKLVRHYPIIVTYVTIWSTAD